MVLLIFLLILIGVLIGKIRVGNIKLGLAGVLMVSLLCGVTASLLDVSYNEEIFKFLSSFGTALFISVIGLNSGNIFLNVQKRKAFKAFIAGAFVVFIGTVCAALLFELVPKDILLGLFSGALTSTPALSSAQELCGIASAVAVGYGVSYVVGLLSIVLFVQIIRIPSSEPQTVYVDSRNDTNKKRVEMLVLLSAVITLGSLLGKVLPIGNTGGILVVGFVVGVILALKGVHVPEMEDCKNLGLVLFFVGAGFPAGMKMISNLSWKYFVCGLAISFCTVILGYFILRHLFRYSIADALTVLCGGMTSTPAIGVLQERNFIPNLSLYAMSYTGALFALILSVRLLYYLI